MNDCCQAAPAVSEQVKPKYSATPACLEAILNTAHDAILAVDSEQHLLLFNAAAQTVFGFSPDQVIGKHIEMLIPLRHRLNHRKLVNRNNALEENQPQPMGIWRQVHGLRSDGSEFPMLASFSRVGDAHNGDIMIVTIRDRSHEAEIEKALRHSIDVDAERHKHHLNIAANITHELKTPLNAIIGFAEILMANPNLFKDETTSMNYVKIIFQAGEKLKAKMTQFIKFSEAEGGSREYFREPVNLAALCNSVLKSLEAEALKNRIAMTLNDIVGIPEIVGDASAIRTILFSIIGNALKFNIPGGKVEVQIITSENEASVTVIDTGIGIPKEQLKFLGRPFFRGNDAYNSQMDGVGLGLALSTSIARGIGAHINIQSDCSNGTIVRIRFPARPDQYLMRDLI